MREFELIETLRRRLVPRRADTRLGAGDDAALLAPPAGQELALTTDTLIAGRHFPVDAPAADIGFKAIAVNLSDLAAMGADPAWMTLSLSVPALDADWCEALIDGALAAIDTRPVDIVGGDITRADTVILGVTALGCVPAGRALRRDGARVGDVIAVTGTLGDAAAGLRLWPDRDSVAPAHRPLLRRLARPTARDGAALREYAHAAIDISDGLLADLGHVLHASGLGATVDLDALPASAALIDYAPSAAVRRHLQATGGDDYELCVCLPEAGIRAAAGALDCDFTVIGRIESEGGLRLRDAAGRRVDAATLGAGGWDHFAAG